MSTQPTITDPEALFEEMTPATRQIAERYRQLLRSNHVDQVLARYDLGVTCARIAADERAYGAEAFRQLAGYLRLDNGVRAISAYRRWSSTYSRDFVRTETAQPMANGVELTTQHWCVLAMVDDGEGRARLYRDMRANGWSSRTLADAVSSSGLAGKSAASGGGRPPAAAATPAAFVAKIRKLCASLHNFVEADHFDASMAELQNSDPVEMSPGFVKSLRDAIEQARLAELDSRQLAHELQGVLATISAVQPSDAVADKAAAYAPKEDPTLINEYELDEGEASAAPSALPADLDELGTMTLFADEATSEPQAAPAKPTGKAKSRAAKSKPKPKPKSKPKPRIKPKPSSKPAARRRVA